MKMKYERTSKKWIYFPSYFLLLFASIYWFYGQLTHEEPELELIVVNKDSKSIMDKTTRCFFENRSKLRGLLRITPPKALTATLRSLSENCKAKVCDELENVNGHDYTTDDHLRLISKECFRAIHKECVTIHNEILSEAKVMGVFFGDGDYSLNKQQKDELKTILKHYRKNARDHGVLAIGRASMSGVQYKNEELSENRASEIIRYITEKEDQLKTDFEYFGNEKPRLSKELADRYGLEKEDYSRIKKNGDRDFKVRLNQSVLLVFYSIEDDPFGLNE